MRGARIARVGLVVFSALATLGTLACRRGESALPPPPAAAQKAEPARPVSVTGGPGGRPDLHVLLDDPRLAQARELARAKDYASAARAAAAAKPADLGAGERCAWDYLVGRLATAGDASVDAAAAFEAAAAPGCPLAGWAKLRAAQATARSGDADGAITRARAVPSEIEASSDVDMVIAESLAAKGDRAGALPLWVAWLAAHPYGPRWVDTSLRIASALLDGVGGPPASRAREAYDLATKVIVEAPKVEAALGAQTLRARASAVLGAGAAPDALTVAERARQAQGWLDAGEPNKAFELASATFAAAKGGSVACRVAVTRAQAAAKARGVKLNGWPDAVTACDKDEQLVSALYTGAKSFAGKEPKRAIEWFAKIEERFPSHRLADDARLRGALLVAQGTEEGHEDRAEQMLLSLPDTYPAGDMGGDALFRVALRKMQRGDWSGAKPVLERAVRLNPDDRHWATAGRADYFLARASAMAGDVDDAKKRYAAVVDRHPLAFYMLLAHARLAELDVASAKQAIDVAAARDVDTVFPSTAHALLDGPAMTRAARLLEVGDVDAAKREFQTSGALAEGVDTEIAWSVGALYNAAGYPELGHVLSRGRLSDHLAHYPVGKWRVPWEVAYPRAFEGLVVKYCGDNGLPAPLAWGVMREESSFVADVRSHAAAYGLMQLIVPTARWVAAGTSFGHDEASLKTPEVSIGLGTRLLAKLRVTHKHPALAIGAYNGGGGAVERWVSARQTDELDLFVELVPYDETRNYIKRVLSSQAAYAYLYDPNALAEPLGLPLKLGR